MSEVLMFRAVFIRVRDKSGVLANVPAMRDYESAISISLDCRAIGPGSC